ncbi:MAG TPA: hypothetical protein VIM58_13095, partial [Candidatus Methylacidiphilales bacterium]
MLVSPFPPLAGHLTLAALPDDAFPVTVRLLHDPFPPQAAPFDVPEQPTTAWNRSGQLPIKRSIPAPLQEVVLHIPARDKALAIPVEGYIAKRTPRWNQVTSLTVTRLEVVASNGEVLGRWIAVDPVAPPIHFSPTIAVSDFSENAPFLKGDRDFRLRTVRSNRETDLSDPLLSAVVVDGPTLADPTLDAGWYRRLLLGGVDLVVPPEIRSATEQKAGLPNQDPVLSAKILTPPVSLKGRYDWKWEESESASSALGSPFQKGYTVRTLRVVEPIVIVLFIAAIGFLLYRSGRLPAERRLGIWIVVPAIALLFSLVILLLPRILGFHSAARVTEYRISYADWPEARIRIDMLV